MRVLVTGINGFLGRYTAEKLADEGHKVIGLGSAENCVVPVDRYIRARLGQCGSRISALCSEIGEADAVVHLAANLSMTFDDEHVIQDNVQGMHDILRLAGLLNCHRFIYMSSMLVYSSPQHEKIDEVHPLAPPTLYHCTKLFGEQLLQVFLQSQTACQGIIFRLASPVGIGMRKNFLPIVLQKARRGEDIVLYGKGGRVQSYIDVRDAAEAIAVSLSIDKDGIFNLGGSESYSNLQVAELCRDLCGNQSQIKFEGTDPHEHECWGLDLHHLHNEFGFLPHYSLADTIQWMLESDDK